MNKVFLIAFAVCLSVATVQAGPPGRVVGGVDAHEGQFPHQVALLRYGSLTCGGSIISSNFVLTAAHCVGPNPREFSIRAGSNNRLSGGVVVGVAEIIVHWGYGDFLNDVALLRLESSLGFSMNIQPIALASDEVPAGRDIVISGWGRLSTQGDLPVTLQWNTLKAISKEECMQKLSINPDLILCVSHERNNGACSGDSGGPAMYNGQLVGVAGFVVNGCGSNIPDGYAKVSYHRDWIRQNSDLQKFFKIKTRNL